MRVARFVLALFGAGVFASAAVRAELEPALPRTLQVATERLPNGLRVIVAPDPSVSSVVVHVRYAGRGTGNGVLLHIVERLMSAGTVHTNPGELESRIDAAGGFASSVATVDHASVFEQVPAGALELALFLEAERMAGLADGIREEELANVKAAIAAEYRAAYEEQPFALVEREVRSRLWGQAIDGGDTLASREALEPVTIETVRAFVRAHVVPPNATLVIVGRVETAAALALARRYFGWIPRGDSRPDPDQPPAVEPAEEVRTPTPPAVPRVEAPRAKVVVGYRAGGVRSASIVHFEIAARALAGGRSSRLVRALVDAGLATEVRAEVIRAARATELRITALATEHTDLDRLADKIRIEVAGLANASDEEQHRAALATAQDLVAAVENLAFRADALASWQAYDGDADQLDAALALVRGAQTSDLRRLARHWLGRQSGVVVIGHPEETR